MMKRIICVLSILCAMFGITGCGDKELNQHSFYKSGTYSSVVDPKLLSGTSGIINLSYFIKKEATGSTIYPLGFWYSDGTSDYGNGRTGLDVKLADNTSWQYYNQTSTAGKTVVGIFVGYNYNAWLNVGNLYVEWT